jgi:membrane protease YdiL (CAAX protease family)
MVRFGALMVIAYAIIVPFQEFAARGALQGPLERFLTGRYATLLAIVIANGLFVASHLHISPTFALASFLPGVLWGWLYSRSHTLIGPIVSHTLIGTTGLYVLDFQRLLVH